MKHLLILASKKNENKGKFVFYLRKYLGKKVEIVLAEFNDLVFEIEKGNLQAEVGSRDICDFDLVYFRGTKDFLNVARTLAVCLEFHKIKFLDPVFKKISFSGGKVTALARLAADSLPIAPTFFCDRDKILECIDRIILKFGLPLITKEISSQRQEEIYVIKDRKDFRLLLSTGKKNQFLFQKFIPIEKEYRLLVLGNKVKVAHTKVKRTYRDFKVSYFDPKEKVKFLRANKFDAKLRKIAVMASECLKLEIAGVDVCIEELTRKIWLLEVNRGPGLTYDTKISPEMRELASFFLRELKWGNGSV